MAKIAGIIARNPEMPTQENLTRMLRGMSHAPGARESSWENGKLGVRIGWVSAPGELEPAQVIWNETRDILLLFCGEAFPSPAEIAALRAKGHLISGTPQNYLVHDFEENGMRFLERVNGRFCGFLVDLRTNTSALFNDRFGMGRLYFSETPEAFYFATEAKALLAALPETRSFDQRSLAELVSLGCPLQDRSLYTKISILPCAASWSFCPGEKPTRNSYFCRDEWENQPPLEPASYEEAFRDVFNRAIQRRFQDGDQQRALSLTGGLDSRMVLAWTPPEHGRMSLYTFGGPYRDCADVKIAKKIAVIRNQPHTTIRVGPDFYRQFTELAEQCVYLTDGIAEVWGAVELYVNRIAARIAPVRLTGNYGSEILRSSLAFRPRNLKWDLFAPEFHPLLKQAEATYSEELQGNRLSFIAFKQVPWYHYALFSLERTALVPRSPFLDNEVVALAYRAPDSFGTPKILELIQERCPRLGSLQTDRAYTSRAKPILSSLARARQEFTVRAEYAYDYGMPSWASKVDRLLAPLHLERLFLGHHKFYHYRIWYRDQLGAQVQAIALDSCPIPDCYRQGAIPEMIQEHRAGWANHTRELHKLLTIQLVQKLLLKKVWDT